jgi:protein-S-isoprenylcysteine O-methyltransferase Ste14
MPRKIMPPTYMLIAMLSMIVFSVFLPVARIIPSPWNLLGLIPITLGVYIAVVAEKSFRDAKTTVTPFVESAALVTQGTYRISRNPMYLGFVLVLVGIAILLRALMPFFVIPVFMALIQTNFIRKEEEMLAAKFGLPYIAYTKTVHRWL